MLKVNNYSLSLKGSDGRILPVLEGVSFLLPQGKCLGVAGESGSGKSVMALSIAGLLPSGAVHKASGNIELADVDISKSTEEQLRKIRGRQIGFIFQEPMTAMNPLMTVYDQIAETVEAHEPSLKSDEVHARVIKALRRSGFEQPEKFISSFPHQLSGGMRQRAMIAMALVMEPQLVIADEPTTAIDAGLQVQLLAELRSQIDKDGRTMIFISHDLGVIRAVSDYLAVFYCGVLVEFGPAKAVLGEPGHPYTFDLAGALPRLVSERMLPVPISGNMPAPDARPNGCVYSDRCRNAQEKCRSTRPPAVEIAENRKVACFFPLSGKAGLKS